MKALAELGWAKFLFDPAIARWANAALPIAEQAAKAAKPGRGGLECEGTWFVGLEALPNHPNGALGDVELTGAVMDALKGAFGFLPLHKAQASIIYPGYPKPRTGESGAAFRYRLRRDAAHVDGLHAVGADRRRFLREPHAYILGLPLSDSAANASPLVIWEGSHTIMHGAFRAALSGVPVDDWPEVDLTEIYQAARRRVFDTCNRVEVQAKPGETYVVHRHALHGIAPWNAPDEPGRAIAYFRPEVAAWGDWLSRA